MFLLKGHFFLIRILQETVVVVNLFLVEGSSAHIELIDANSDKWRSYEIARFGYFGKVGSACL